MKGDEGGVGRGGKLNACGWIDWSVGRLLCPMDLRKFNWLACFAACLVGNETEIL